MSVKLITKTAAQLAAEHSSKAKAQQDKVAAAISSLTISLAESSNATVGLLKENVEDILGVIQLQEERIEALSKAGESLASVAKNMEEMVAGFKAKVSVLEEQASSKTQPPTSGLAKLMASQLEATMALVQALYYRQHKIEEAVIALYKLPFLKIDLEDKERSKLKSLLLDFEAHAKF